MSFELWTHDATGLTRELPRLEAFVARHRGMPLSRHPAWLRVLAKGLGHEIYCLEAFSGEKTTGLLPLAFVRSLLFGKFLVSLPYLNHGGVLADDETTASKLVGRAVELADELKVRYLELRQEKAVEHPALISKTGAKVHMRLNLPCTTEQLWNQLPAKVRNQIRKGQKSDLSIEWGREDLLADFYAVFCQNMRDLGTPVYGLKLFANVLAEFPDRAELAVVRLGKKPVAAALMLHGWGVSEVPSASSLKAYRRTNANMLMYWHLLERAVQREQETFDFGRSSPESSTYRFKKQWGAEPCPAVWQYYLRSGDIGDMRPDNPKYQRFIRVWQRLPVAVTRWIGPWIVRGIP